MAAIVMGNGVCKRRRPNRSALPDSQGLRVAPNSLFNKVLSRLPRLAGCGGGRGPSRLKQKLER